MQGVGERSEAKPSKLAEAERPECKQGSPGKAGSCFSSSICQHQLSTMLFATFIACHVCFTAAVSELWELLEACPWKNWEDQTAVNDERLNRLSLTTPGVYLFQQRGQPKRVKVPHCWLGELLVVG